MELCESVKPLFFLPFCMYISYFNVLLFFNCVHLFLFFYKSFFCEKTKVVFEVWNLKMEKMIKQLFSWTHENILSLVFNDERFLFFKLFL